MSQDEDRIRRLLQGPSSGGLADSASAAETRIGHEDLILGKIALEWKLISEAQLAEAAGEQKTLRGQGRDVPLGKILASKGWLRNDDLLRLHREQGARLGNIPNLVRYEIRECAGEGATAVVYRAWDRELKRMVALKLLRELTGMSDIARTRFRREATVAASLLHPNVVTVYDAGEQDGRLYLVMELIEGLPLSTVLREGRWPTRDLLALLEKAARGVAAAHQKGIVHRDLKPANILVTGPGDAKVADFGLAHLMDSATALTRTGTELGTPYYMSPEQVEGRPGGVTPATDVYALGAILYEVLTGRPPHARESMQETFAAILHQEPPPLRKSNARIAGELETIVLKALEKEPGRRYATAEAFAEDLRRYLAGEPIEAVASSAWRRGLRRMLRNRVLVVSAAVFLGMAAASGILVARLDSQGRRNLAAEREVARRREAALQELGTLHATILDRTRELRQLRVSASQARGDLDAAVRDVDRFVDRWPEFPQGYYVRARGRMALGDLSGAEADLRAALVKQPEFRPGWSVLGVLKVQQYQSGLEGQARTWSEHLRALAPLLDEASEAFSRGWSGRQVEEAGRWGLAWTREDQVVERLARSLRLFFHDKNHEAAARLVMEGDREYPSEEYALWGALFYPAGKDRIRFLDQAIQRAPGYSLPYYFRGGSVHAGGDPRGAVSDFDKAIALDPSFAAAYEKRAQARQDLGDLKGALADYTRALDLRPKFLVALVNRGIVKAALADLAGARADFDLALAVDPRSPHALMNRGNAKQVEGDFEGALADFNRGIEADAEIPALWFNRGITRIKRNDGEGALADLTRAIELNPAYYQAYSALGLVHEFRGELQKAATDYQEALRRAPETWPGRRDAEGRLRRIQDKLKEN